MSDQEMYLMSEKQIIGGISVTSHKYAKANNPYLPDYNENEETSYLFQGDVNNLYGWAMSQKLPCGDFKWEEPELPKHYDPEGDIGYVLEVYLEFTSKELKNLVDECSLVSRRSSYYIWLNRFHQTFIPFQMVQIDLDAYQSIAVV